MKSDAYVRLAPPLARAGADGGLFGGARGALGRGGSARRTSALVQLLFLHHLLLLIPSSSCAVPSDASAGSAGVEKGASIRKGGLPTEGRRGRTSGGGQGGKAGMRGEEEGRERAEKQGGRGGAGEEGVGARV